jgi:hypothetical protein
MSFDNGEGGACVERVQKNKVVESRSKVCSFIPLAVREFLIVHKIQVKIRAAAAVPLFKFDPTIEMVVMKMVTK